MADQGHPEPRSGDFDASVVASTAHRPWPVPQGPWVMSQTWHDLLFAHWPVSRDRLRALVPSAFELDLFDGTAWVGVVPFRMTNVGPRGATRLPWVSAFPELNVRTYVRVGERAGVYFFSLDAASALAVSAARTLLNLPYFTARMAVMRDGDVVRYRSQRSPRGPAEFVGTYAPNGDVSPASAGTLEHFLTERYCLYQLTRAGAPYRLEIHHPRWPLQVARATIDRNTMADAAGLALPGVPPLLHFARRLDVVAWPPIGLRQ